MVRISYVDFLVKKKTNGKMQGLIKRVRQTFREGSKSVIGKRS